MRLQHFIVRLEKRVHETIMILSYEKSCRTIIALSYRSYKIFVFSLPLTNFPSTPLDMKLFTGFIRLENTFKNTDDFRRSINRTTRVLWPSNRRNLSANSYILIHRCRNRTCIVRYTFIGMQSVSITMYCGRPSAPLQGFQRGTSNHGYPKKYVCFLFSGFRRIEHVSLNWAVSNGVFKRGD